MNKKLLGIIAMLMVVALALTACGGSSAPASSAAPAASSEAPASSAAPAPAPSAQACNAREAGDSAILCEEVRTVERIVHNVVLDDREVSLFVVDQEDVCLGCAGRLDVDLRGRHLAVQDVCEHTAVSVVCTRCTAGTHNHRDRASSRCRGCGR